MPRDTYVDNYIKELSKQSTPYEKNVAGVKLRIEQGINMDSQNKILKWSFLMPNIILLLTFITYSLGRGFHAGYLDSFDVRESFFSQDLQTTIYDGLLFYNRFF